MSEAEKQEGQKTVVSFITGLLIGGLLVWVFSSSPENTPKTDTEETGTEETASVDTGTEKSATITETTETSNVPVTGTGSIKVADQNAGDSVALGMVSYPGENGWVVVRDYANGESGKILGAARYSVADGLAPIEVSLLRKTVKGSTYQVMFYTESGDKKFSTPDDVAVAEGATTFKAN
jgi:hypothetical protein